MKKSVISLAAGAVAFIALAGSSYADDAKQLTAQQAAEIQTKVRVGIGVVALGRADKDPMMLVVGAKILSGVDLDGSEKTYDVSAILDEAKALAGDNEMLLDAIAAVPTERANRSGERNCDWVQVQGYGSDPYAWGWVLSCY